MVVEELKKIKPGVLALSQAANTKGAEIYDHKVITNFHNLPFLLIFSILCKHLPGALHGLQQLQDLGKIYLKVVTNK